MLRTVALGLALLTAGCAGKQVVKRPVLPVRVTTLQVDFPARDRGRLEFTLQLPEGASARAVSWELFLEGVRFAAGVESLSEGSAREVSVSSALVSRHLNWREGDAALEVGLRGEVEVVGGARLPFRERREVGLQGRPLFHGGD